MKSNNTKIVLGSAFLVALLLTLITACGGGGDSGGSNNITATHWTKQFGVAGKNTEGDAVAIDANGNIYVSGSTNGGLDGNTLMGTTDFFLTKYNSSGTRLYTRQLGVAGKDTRASGVATDASGNVYVAGETYGALDGNALTGDIDFFLTKYDSSGTKLYTRQLGVAGSGVRAQAVATDASGNVYVAGYTFGGLDGNTKTGSSDFFLTKYTSSGTKIYTKQLGVTGKVTSGYAVATDANGNVYVSGDTNGGLDGNTLTGTDDFFFTKYNASGHKLYTMQMGVAGKDTRGYGVATDASGNVYVTGYTYGQLDGNALMGTADFFLVKYDSSANKLYSRQLGVAGATTYGEAVATDASGNIYVSGYTGGGLDGKTLTGSTDLFLTKYNASGTKIYTKQMGVAGKGSFGSAVATDASGNVYVSGTTLGGLDGNTLTGTADFYLTKYDSAGN